MEVHSSFSIYIHKTLGNVPPLFYPHMDHKTEMDLVAGCLKILRESKGRKQTNSKLQIYNAPHELVRWTETEQKALEQIKRESCLDFNSSSASSAEEQSRETTRLSTVQSKPKMSQPSSPRRGGEIKSQRIYLQSAGSVMSARSDWERTS